MVQLTGFFFNIHLLVRCRPYICKSKLLRQTFASFKSRYLAAGAVASDVPCHFSNYWAVSVVSFFLLLLGKIPLLCCSCVVFEALSALEVST